MTVTVTAPVTCAGVLAVMVVPFTTTTFVAAAPSKVRVAPAAKFAPVIVTEVPPVTDPVLGFTFPIKGAVPVAERNATICITHGPF